MKYGLKDAQMKAIIAILEKYPQIENVLIFGSRALGNYLEASDVDIALKGKGLGKTLYKIKDDFEESDLPYFVDVVDYQTIDHPPFKQHIDDNGIVIYRKGWREVRLGDVAEINPAELLPKGTKAKKVNMDALIPFTRKISKYVIENYKGGSKFKNGDTLLSRITPCLENGKTAFVDFLKPDEIGFGSTEFIVIREKENITDKNFIYYFAMSENFREMAIKSMTGTSGRQRVPTDNIRKYQFFLPPLAEQKAIAEVLAALDDKIDLLRRQNRTLENLAQTLFRHWFIDHPERGDWEKVKLGDYFPVITGKKNANYSTENGQYPFFTCAQNILKAPDYSFEGKAILLAGNGDFNVKRYDGKFEAYQRTYVLIPYQEKYFGFLYILIKYYLNNITGGAQGSVINFITKGMISDFQFSIPQTNFDNHLFHFNEIYTKIDANQSQICNLEKQRDTLLPKLMNGAVRVKSNSGNNDSQIIHQ